jgi:hypothetical protein
MYTQSYPKIWIVPSGRYYGTVESAFCCVTREGVERLRLVFKLRDKTGAETENRAGINFRTSHPGSFARAIEFWLGQEQLDKLFPEGEVKETNFRQLIGRNAILDVATEDHGRENPLVVIRQIFPDNPAYLNAGAGSSDRVLLTLPRSDRMHPPQ